MNNKSSKYNDEIDLSELSKVIWDGKIKIILITLISFAIIFGYQKIKPPVKQIKYQNNILTIKPVSDGQFLKFLPVMNFLNQESSLEIFYSEELVQKHLFEERIKLLDLSSEAILVEFIEEIRDHEELVSVLNNTQSVKERISKLSESDQLKELYKFAKKFSVQMSSEQLNQRLEYYDLSFIWNNPEEASIIMNETIKLALKNLRETIFNKIENIYHEKKRIIYSQDSKRIAFLHEQSLIARELNIKDNEIGDAYYLRGYKAIDNEIKIIKNRKYSELNNIKKIIDDLKQKDFSWIDYNVLLMEVVNEAKPGHKQKDPKIPLYLSIIFGLIIGLLYVFISNKYQSK